MLINKTSLSALFTGFKAAFNTGFRDSKSYWPQIATVVPSTTKEEKYGWLGQFPKLREWLGDRQVKNMEAHDYSIKNKKFESTIAIPRDDLDDDTFGVFTPLFQEMGFAAQTHPDELVFDLLKAGFATLCYDGQYFFDTDHPVGDGVVSNTGGGGGNGWFLLDVRRPLKPLIFQKRRDYALKSMVDENDENVWKRDEFQYGIDARANVGFGFWQQAFGSKDVLSDANFKTARQSMQEFKSDEGKPLGIMPNVLLVGPSNQSAAETLIKARDLAGGGSNTLYNAVELIVVPWLD